MDDDAEAAEAAAAFEPREQIRGELERLDRHAQHQLPRMQRERLVGANLDLAHDLVDVHALAQVDVSEAAVFEHAEPGAQPEIDGTAAKLRLEIDRRRDADLAGREVQTDVTIGEDQ